MAKSEIKTVPGCLSEIVQLVRLVQMRLKIKVITAAGNARPASKTHKALTFHDQKSRQNLVVP